MMTRDDWAALTDADSAAQLELALADRDRRERIATIPTQVSQLAELFVSGGGDPAKIEGAVMNVTQVSTPELERSWSETLPGPPVGGG